MLLVSCTTALDTQAMPSACWYKYFRFLLEGTLRYVGSKLSRLVIIPKDDGIRWVNILSPLSVPQGGKNPELCYVLSPSISSMANPQKFLIANTIDPESPIDCLPSLPTFPPLSWCF